MPNKPALIKKLISTEFEVIWVCWWVLFWSTHWVVKDALTIVVASKMLVFRNFIFFKFWFFVTVQIIFQIDRKTHRLCFTLLCNTFLTDLNVFYISVLLAILKYFLPSFLLPSLVAKTLYTIEFVSNYLLWVQSFIWWKKICQFVHLNLGIHPCRRRKYAWIILMNQFS